MLVLENSRILKLFFSLGRCINSDPGGHSWLRNIESDVIRVFLSLVAIAVMVVVTSLK